MVDFGGAMKFVQATLPQIIDCVPSGVKEKAMEMGKDLAVQAGQVLMEEAGKQLEQIGVKMQGTDVSKIFDMGMELAKGLTVGTPLKCFPDFFDAVDIGKMMAFDLDRFMPKPPANFDFGTDVNITINIDLGDLKMPGLDMEMVKELVQAIITQLGAGGGPDAAAAALPAAAPSNTAPAGGAQATPDAAPAGDAGKTEGTSGTGGTGGAGEAGKTEEKKPADPIVFNGKELEHLKRTDPEAFAERLNNMSPEDRNAAMMELQTHLQQINQMFSMMSNFAKVEHDTMKAIIGNMRV